MDTKLKKSEMSKSQHSAGVKFLCILLALGFAFLSGVQLISAVRANLFYKTSTGKIENTYAFLSQLNHDISALTTYYSQALNGTVKLDYDEFCEKTILGITTEAQFDQMRIDALEIYDTIIALKKRMPSDGADVQPEYDYGNSSDYAESSDEIDNNGTYTEIYAYSDSYAYPNIYDLYSFNEAENPADYKQTSCGFDRSILNILDSYSSYEQWSNDYNALRSVLFSIVNDATDRSSVISDVEKQRSDFQDNNYSSYIFNYDENLNNIEIVKSFTDLKYVLRDKTSGKLYSNIKGEAAQREFLSSDDTESIYTLNYVNGKLLSGAAATDKKGAIFSFLNKSGFLGVKDIDESYLNSLGSSADMKVSIVKTGSDSDPYSLIYNMFSRTGGKLNRINSALSLLFAILSIAAIVVLCQISGRRKDGSIKLTLTDRVFFIIHLALTLALLVISGSLLTMCFYYDFTPNELSEYGEYTSMYYSLFKYGVGFCFMLASATITSFVLYIARNSKADTLHRRFIIGIISDAATKAKMSNAGITASLTTLKHRIYRTIALYIAGNVFSVLMFIAGSSSDFDFLAILSLMALAVGNILAILYCVRFVNDVLRLSGFAEEIRNGNYEPEITPSDFCKPLQKFANDLKACRDSIQVSVEEAVKGEKMKTELITNVSHDLKTPLTSIINYVSLLKLCDIKGEDERKYLDVLEDKSRKLQRLIEDLTEASKATSGNVHMNISVVDFGELALQAVGENNDVLEAVGLEIVYGGPTLPVIVDADSQHTFRVIDNLFSNVKKYALSGTRVYVDVYEENGYGVFAVKNVSKAQLNINSEELTERFVRGDNSRTTDGSGLGLSIARSLTEMQHGLFSIEIDGDLFKACIRLPLHIFTAEEKEAFDKLQRAMPVNPDMPTEDSVIVTAAEATAADSKETEAEIPQNQNDAIEALNEQDADN